MLCNETLDVISLNAIPLNIHEKVCGFCTLYIILFAVFFITSICICSVFIYFHWHLKKIMFVLSFILVLKQQFNGCTFIKCNSIGHINGKYQTNYY